MTRAVDAKLAAALGKDDLDAWIVHFQLSDLIKKVSLETKPEKRNASLRRIFRSKAPMMLEAYEKYYLGEEPA